ncbi:MAG: hypothetical protein AAF378_25495 [Cyanobacteria bacterium P01_A01_bin.84]
MSIQKISENKSKVLVLAFLANPTCTNWIYGFKSLGYDVAVLNWSNSPATQEQLNKWGFSNNDIPIFHFWDKFSETISQAVLNSLDGTPDIIFSWEGALILEPLQKVSSYFPTAKVVHCVNTYPNAISNLSEVRMNSRYRKANSLISGYIFYSETQQNLFSQKIPSASNKPYIAMIEPFFDRAFSSKKIADANVPRLERFDKNPHIIFTGRGNYLWSKPWTRFRRDALGLFLSKLAKRGIHIFLSSQADTKGLPNLHKYPNFSNEDIFEGRFSQYISQFDAHLVMYNEYNNIMRRWTSSGLSTRFAYSLTATAPIAVTKTSKFVEELWKDTPFGFTFTNTEDLAQSLYDKQYLTLLSHNMEKIHRSYSFESQSKRIAEFFNLFLKRDFDSVRNPESLRLEKLR